MKTIFYLPHNFLAEKMFLSCLIFNSTLINNVIKNISSENFYFKNHQELFKILVFMSQNEKRIDIITLTTFIQENGLLKQVGGIKILIDLLNQIPNTLYLEEYIRIIKDKFLRRKLIKLGYKAINSGYITNISLEKTLLEFEQQFFTLNNNLQIHKLSNTFELLSKVYLDLKQNVLKPSFPGLRSGFYDLDSLTQGFQKSDLIIIAGRPSIGKTAFSLSLTLNIIKSVQKPIIFFSLEMSKEQLIYRILSMETNISQLKLKSGNLNKNEWRKLTRIIKILSKVPFFIDDNSNLSIQDIHLKLKTFLFNKKNIGLLIIDYLQLIQTNQQLNNRAQELGNITRSLKTLAREFKIPIIVLSQLSRNVEYRNNQKPILADLRESGSIEQDADLVLMLTRNFKEASNLRLNTYKIIIDLIIAKQRNGPLGTIKLYFDQKSTKYLNFN